ncbi:hypothetical protein POTOM_047217 [Populus tomentosa]|uniref:F-box domain-containing protein n=1 Tax=Populus tomentosa TaxID=118781 RepID=A0A8X7YHG1_POPTO|nr:hypothetical protein POTOM_047217 [Populus tomentosa]
MAKDNRRKRYKKANKDMICRLPNEILGHVLSFLPIKDASTWKLSFFLYKQWISAAIKDNLEGLILYTSDHVLLPRRIFSCEKLVVLDLSYRIDIDLLGVGVRIPCLKPLYSLVETALSVAYEHVFTIQVDDYIDMHGSSLFETDHAYCQELTITLSDTVHMKLPGFDNLPDFRI